MSRSSKRSRATSKQVQPLPATLHDAQVLSIREWSQLANISTRTAKRLFVAGAGPKRVQLSSNRCGVTIAAHRQWLAARERL